MSDELYLVGFAIECTSAGSFPNRRTLSLSMMHAGYLTTTPIPVTQSYVLLMSMMLRMYCLLQPTWAMSWCFFGGEWKKNLINLVRDSRARLCTILLGRLSNWVEELTLVLEETLNYLDVCRRLEWSVEWWQGPQSKYIIARQPEVFTVQWNHTTLLDAIDELDGKGCVLRHWIRITIDIVHSTICQLELECGRLIELAAAFELTVILGKFDHSIHRIRWIRLDDLVCDTQFNIGPSNVELMLKIVASVWR